MSHDTIEQNCLKELNEKIKNYENLGQKEKKDVLTSVRNDVKKSREVFEQMISESECDLSRLIFIVGATGVGKSTLLNYLNGLPLVIGKSRLGPILECDENVKTRSNYAKIAHGKVSQTSIPNFAKSSNGQLTYVDCAGEFDNKDVLQSIINSYFKKDLADKAKEISIAIAVNYFSLSVNTGGCFTQVLDELSKFTNNWSQLQHSTTLIVTNVPYQDGIKDDIMNEVADIAENVKDLGVFKPVLESICRRKSISFFLQPFRVEFKIPVGQPYMIDSDRTKGIGTIESIKKTIESVEPTSVREVQFNQCVNPKAQKIIEGVCQDLINQMQASIIYAIQSSVRSWGEEELKIYKIVNKQDIWDYISEPSFSQSDYMDLQAFANMSDVNINCLENIKRTTLEKEVAERQSEYDRQARQQAEQQAETAQEEAKQAKKNGERKEREISRERKERELSRERKEKAWAEWESSREERVEELSRVGIEKSRSKIKEHLSHAGAAVGLILGGPVGSAVGFTVGESVGATIGCIVDKSRS